MARPIKQKQLERPPEPVIYMPAGWTQQNVQPAEISVEDFEVMRLVDAEGLNLDATARRMDCSPSTVGRMLERTRRILAQAISVHAPICIDAGEDSNFSSTRPLMHPTGRLAAAVEADHAETFVAGIFGRAPYFAIRSGVGSEMCFMPNPGYSKKRHAANSAVQCLSEAGVQRVAAGRFGPDALKALAKARIEPLLLRGLSLTQFEELYRHQ